MWLGFDQGLGTGEHERGLRIEGLFRLEDWSSKGCFTAHSCCELVGPTHVGTVILSGVATFLRRTFFCDHGEDGDGDGHHGGDGHVEGDVLLLHDDNGGDGGDGGDSHGDVDATDDDDVNADNTDAADDDGDGDDD